jgi:predicted alpha/beta-hydrolase family hydrolase
MAAKKKAPDRAPVLEATWRAAIDAVRVKDRKIVVGGRSMGGRIASQVVAQGVKVDALALFAYPLHPPGRPDRMRDEHLPSIGCRTLFCSGSNDAFASPDELREAASKVKRANVHLLEGADHGFAVKRASGRTRDDVWAEAVEALVRWLRV